MKQSCLLMLIFIACYSNSNAQIPQIHNGHHLIFHSMLYQPLTHTTYTGFQGIYRNSFFLSAGYYISSPVTIHRIYFRLVDVINTTTYYNFTVKLGHTYIIGYPPSSQSATNVPWIPGSDTVLNAANFTLSNLAYGTWVPIDLDIPFVYNGGLQELLVEVTHQGYIGDGINISRSQNNQNNIILGTSPYTFGDKYLMHIPYFGFDIEQDWDAGLVSFISPPANDSFCMGINPITVVVHNAGLQDIDSVCISWEANGVPQGTYYHFNTMPSNSYDTVTIGWYNFPNGIPVNLKAYTSLPQGTSDVFNTNDTIQGSFTATKDFVSNFNVGIGNDTAICTGDTIMLNAGAGTNTLVTFLWDDNSTNQTRSVNTGGTYYVTVTDTNDCMIIDTIIVTDQQPIVDLGNDTTICEGEVVIFDAQNTGATYLWDDNSTNQLRYASNAQTYYVTVTDNIGCTGSDTVNVSHIPLPSGQITATLVQGLTYNFDIFNPVNVTSALWNFGDGNTASGLFVTHTYNAIDTYNVSVLMYGVCNVEMSGNDEYQLIIGDTTSIHTTNIHNPQGIEIYPNPFDKGFTIKLPQDKGEIYNLSITDLLGRNVLNLNGTIETLNKEVADKELESGQYILRLQNKETRNIYTVRLVGIKK